jgi:hypothetical protein
MKERQFEVNHRNRHLRYVFFIDENISYDDLLSLIAKNKQLWGGRFNPIIPVKSNEIEESWKNFARCFDPDVVLYSKGINVNIIHELNCYNQCKISEIYFESLDYSIQGIPSAWLINAPVRRDIHSDVERKLHFRSGLWLICN